MLQKCVIVKWQINKEKKIKNKREKILKID